MQGPELFKTKAKGDPDFSEVILQGSDLPLTVGHLFSDMIFEFSLIYLKSIKAKE